MNMELKIINIKLKASKFVHLGCGNLTEEEQARIMREIVISEKLNK